MTRTAEAGFTLIEVLVSLALFALIATAGVSVLDQVLRAQTQTEARLDRLAAVQRMMHLISRDISEAHPGSLTGDAGRISLMRQGDNGPTEIGYHLAENILSRAVNPAGGTPRSIVVLPQTADLRFRFLDDRGQWHDDWQLPSQPNQPALRAVEMTAVVRPANEGLRRLMILPQQMPPGVAAP
jgi:general secretion pathway protein J